MQRALKCAKAPCKSCPYRRDVPSGVWQAREYDKLPAYDGTKEQQLLSGGRSLFDCHQQDGNLCAGWVGTHGAHNLIAFRLTDCEVDPSIWRYESPVPLFKSGAEACAHGKRHIRHPRADATRMVIQLLRKRERRK